MIIITAPVHPFVTDTLAQKGYEYLYVPDIDYAGLFDQIDQATGLIVTTRISIDRPMIEKAVKLNWIGRLGSGMELIDVKFAEAKNIRCVSSPEGNSNAVAEHALGMLLSLMHQISKSSQEVRSGLWLRNENRGTELSGKTVGIVGYGNTGSAFARILSSFNLRILALDKYKSGFGSKVVEESDWEEICREADVVSFHLPLTAETLHMGNTRLFEKLKKNPIIINTSRGKIIQTQDLVHALQHKLIGGAALDVLENEHLPSLNPTEQEAFEFLTRQQNVLITPHIAGYSHEAYLKMGQIIFEKLGII